VALSADGTSAPEPVGGLALEELAVWTVDGLTRVGPTEASGPGRAVELAAARNEYEAGQVVLRASRLRRNIGVEATDLVGPVGAVIDRRYVSLFRVHYLRVQRPSVQSPYPAGWWPDALIPLRDPETGQPLPGGRLSAAPFDLRPAQNQPIWVEVYVPADVPAGTYRGAVHVTEGSAVVTTVPLTLQVWDFTLPRRPSLASHFGDFRRVAAFHGVAEGGPEYLRIAGRYEDMLIAHRLMPKRPERTAPVVRPDGTVEFDKTRAAMAHYFDGLGVNSWQMPLGEHHPFQDPLGVDRARTVRYLRDLYRHLVENGWGERAYVYPLDEPNTPAQYQRARDFAALAREADPRIRVLLTEAPRARPTAWGTLHGSVDIWTMLFRFFDDPTVRERLRSQGEVWSYTALTDQGPATLPHWALDFPLVAYRIPGWLNWRYRVSGMLYWTTVYWVRVSDPWIETNTYPYGQLAFNGEGVLFYPGSAVGYAGPAPSVRLKALRDGMEDYEYLRILADRGAGSAADEAAGRVARSWTDWDRDGAAIRAMRERLAQQIVALKRPGP
jgi:hypothetical protein